MGDDVEKYRFVVEWFDSRMQTTRTFLLTYFPVEKSVEMYDVRYKKVFLRKTKCEDVKLDDLYRGSIVTVLTRQLNVVDYGDAATRERFGTKIESALCVVKDSGLPHLGKILDIIHKNGLQISKAKMVKLCEEVDPTQYGEEHHALLVAIMPGPVVAFELRGQNGFAILQQLLVGLDSETKHRSDLVELGEYKSLCVGSKNQNTMKNDLEYFFPSSGSAHCNTAAFRNTTCCIIKPHAVREGLTGKVIQAIIDGGFQITALEMFSLDYGTAEEFFEVYKGVVAEYLDMVSQMASGPCIAMEISSSQENVCEQFRQFVGPPDPEVARYLRPHTLRANFGINKVRNAVHCTDLAEDSTLEVEYFFRILTLY